MTLKLFGAIASLLALTSAACAPTTDVVSHGSVSATWSITVRDQPIPCAHVGAASVSLRLHPRASTADLAFTFPCTAGMSVTPQVTGAIYDATLSLVGSDGTTIATAPTQPNITIGAGQAVALAPFAFAVDDRGQLVLSFTALGTNGNCTNPHHGGGGVSTNQIMMRSADGACAAVTFTRQRGTAMLGTYTVDCSAPPAIPCLEQDETLAISGLTSGPYALAITGNSGMTLCWLGEDVLSVPAAGATLTKPIQLAHLRGTGC